MDELGHIAPPFPSRVRDGPAWRWRYAQRLAGEADPECKAILAHGVKDALILLAADYLQQSVGGEPPVADPRYATLARARAVWDDPAKQSPLKILTMAGCPLDETAQHWGESLEVVQMARSMFFDVRRDDDSPGWLRTTVIDAETNAEFASRLKFAWGAGPVMARAILECDARSVEEAGISLFELQLKLYARLHYVLETPWVGDSAKLRYYELFTAHRRDEGRIKLAEAKLRLAWERECRRKLQAQARLERERHRREQQAAAQSRRAHEKPSKVQPLDSWASPQASSQAEQAASLLEELEYLHASGPPVGAKLAEAAIEDAAIPMELTANPVPKPKRKSDGLRQRACPAGRT